MAGQKNKSILIPRAVGFLLFEKHSPLPLVIDCLVLCYSQPSSTLTHPHILLSPLSALYLFSSEVVLGCHIFTSYTLRGCQPEQLMHFYSHFPLEAQNVQKKSGVAGIMVGANSNLFYCYLISFICLF